MENAQVARFVNTGAPQTYFGKLTLPSTYFPGMKHDSSLNNMTENASSAATVAPAGPANAGLRGVISADGLAVAYKMGAESVHALRGVSLSVSPGERVFLCGPSGAGKTTLLYVLGGLETPTGGRVYVDGEPLYQMSQSDMARLRNTRMGYVFQNYGLLPEFTALENVSMPAMIGGKKAKDRARELLSLVGLEKRVDHLPGQMSGGECQRVAIARALVNDPQFLFADEPTGNLDSRTGGEIMDLMLNVVTEFQKTLLVVTHDQNLAKRGDRILRLTDGLLDAEG
jgi:predicted ABC-type transport system involved in lysophospholipase L1 biosynthesis ATPase subunit